jgi:hypothetical protein
MSPYMAILLFAGMMYALWWFNNHKDENQPP